MGGLLSWTHDISFPAHPKENGFSRQGLLPVCFKQARDVNEMSANPRAGILARLSNPQAVRGVVDPSV